MDLNDIIYELTKEMKLSMETKVGNTQIKGIAYDSRKVKAGYLFIAIKGTQVDGHRYIEDAVSRGAVAVIGEDSSELSNIPYLKVENSRRALAVVSDLFYDSPSKNKFIIGITGTNGKTTTSYLLKHIFERTGISCTMIGTIQNIVNGAVYPTINTTPGPLEINQMLYASEDEVVIMEVSSHALQQCRVDSILFNVALFTNLTHDHLDYHTSMEAYFNVKKRLFNKLKENGTAVINMDDSYGERLLESLREKGVTSFTIGQTKASDVRFTSIDGFKQKMRIYDAGKSFGINTELPGLHNFYNMAMAYITAAIAGIAPEKIISALHNFTGIPGRFQQLKAGEVTCVIDYAHTPDAIFHCLQAARQAGAEQLIHIFGWRADGDETKRAEMLSISSELADRYILTLDNLNGVAEDKMVAQLKKQQSEHGKSNGEIIPDRTLAIQQALQTAKAGDWIVITGKGNETYEQQFHLPCQSDEDTVRFCIERLDV